MAVEVGGAGAPQGPKPPAAPTRAARQATVLPQPSVAVSPASGSPRAVGRRRTVVTRVDLWSVLKLSVLFYVCALLVAMVAGVALWITASAVGVVENSEQFMGDLLSADDFRFLSASILEGSALIGLALVILGVILTVLAAAFYNLFAQLIGGVELIVEDEA